MLRVGGIMDLLRVWGRRRGRPAGGALDEILKGDKALGGKWFCLDFGFLMMMTKDSSCFAVMSECVIDVF